MNLTAANQLTLLRMVLVPPFVILLLYGHQGWALVTFFTAAVTDLFDGLIARRTGQKTTLGAWLDPMADKLLLVSMFVMLTLPDIGSVNRLPLWFTILVLSRDITIVLTVAVVNCGAEGVKGKTPDVTVTKWIDIFLTEPSLARTVGTPTENSDVYVEVIGTTKNATEEGAVQLVKKSVPYLIE